MVDRPIGDLKSNPRNARTHSKRQIRQIAASIEEFGFTNPILIDDSPERRQVEAAGWEVSYDGMEIAL